VEVDQHVSDNIAGVLVTGEAFVDLVEKGSEPLFGERWQRHVTLRHVGYVASRADRGFRYVRPTR
jgi:hypothetical protein